MLAQEWLYGNRASSPYDNMLERHLKQPTKFNPHSTIAVLNLVAERIVFTDDVPTLLYEMNDNRQLTFDGVLTSAKLPYDCFWLEYTTVVGTNPAEDGVKCVNYGALIQRIGSEAVRMFIVIGFALEGKCINTLAYIIDFDMWPPVVKSIKHENRQALSFSVAYAFNYERLLLKKAKQSIMDLGSTVNEIIFGIFLVTQPKVYNDEPVKWKASHAAKRARAKKPPLLEYRKIRLHIMRTNKRYSQRPTSIRSITDTDSEEAVRHRRYHKVMGHFRHYINHSPPHTTWIEPHYRGDPALGVTFTERDVSR